MNEKALKKGRVLIVEDYDIYSEIEAMRLTHAGYEVDKATNGKEALDLYLNNEPWTYQAILMDIIMPVMDGREASRRIRASKREDSFCIPIISISADNSEDAIKKSLQSGIDVFLEKPIDFLDLFEKLEKLIKQSDFAHYKKVSVDNGGRYDKLWKKLIDMHMTKTDLRLKINCSSATLAKLSKGEDVSVGTLRKICEVLDCSLNDIISVKNIK